MIESVHGAFAQRQQADILIPLEPKYPHRIFHSVTLFIIILSSVLTYDSYFTFFKKKTQ